LRILKVVLRVVLTVLLVFVAVRVVVMLAPGLALFGAGRGTATGMLGAGGAGVAHPDWGGGKLSVTDRSVASIVDSARKASKGNAAGTRVHGGRGVGVVLEPKPDSDYAITVAVPSPDQPGRTALFEVPSASHFRNELLPRERDVEAPARDIPVYPRSRCRAQVGRGTAYFVGFYVTSDSVEAVRSFYVEALGRLGWRRVPGRSGPVETFAKQNEGRAVLLQLREQDSVTTRIGLVAMASGNSNRSERK
jgi:hypothetical protein